MDVSIYFTGTKRLGSSLGSGKVFIAVADQIEQEISFSSQVQGTFKSDASNFRQITLRAECTGGSSWFVGNFVLVRESGDSQRNILALARSIFDLDSDSEYSTSDFHNLLSDLGGTEAEAEKFLAKLGNKNSVSLADFLRVYPTINSSLWDPVWTFETSFWFNISNNQRTIEGGGSTDLVSDPKTQVFDSLPFDRVRMQLLAKCRKMISRGPTQVWPDNLIRGVDSGIDAEKRVVRIFTSSTFTDTEDVRNVLMAHGYPMIAGSVCRILGLSLQIIDMRWGVRKSTDDDHGTSELCMSEIRRCLAQSVGPAFVTMLCDKTGYRPFPRKIERHLFEMLREEAGRRDADDAAVLASDGPESYWTFDENAIPPVYAIKKKSLILPNILNPDQQKSAEASGMWWRIFERIQRTLRSAARALLAADKISAETADIFIISVTAEETINGIVDNPARDSNAFMFRRKFAPTPSIDDAAAAKYIDIAGGEIDSEAADLIQQLKYNILPKALSPTNIRDYTVPWVAGGIDVVSNIQHRDHVLEMALHIATTIGDGILAGFRDHWRKSDEILNEILTHLIFRKQKRKIFVGRSEELEVVSRYLLDPLNTAPLILHGPSGVGKTALMAAASAAASEAFADAINITRFLGTSYHSANGYRMLRSICMQIVEALGGDRLEIPALLADLGPFLNRILSRVVPSDESQKPRLVIFLDSLDQLSDEDSSKDLEWLPKTLPPAVKIVVSTLPDVGGCLAAAKASLADAHPDNFLEINPIDNSKVFDLVQAYLSAASRRVGPEQWRVVTEAMAGREWIPLYLKLVIEDIKLWPSHLSSPPPPPPTIKGMIFQLFERLESRHGDKLVSHALALITISRHGLSSAEIEDILSLDDEVLNDVYEWWQPPLRRLPPSLWVRISHDLEGYLVDRGAEGVAWFHRQFREAAADRYLSNPSIVHAKIGDFFSGRWVDVSVPYTDKQGRKSSAVRHIMDHSHWVIEGSVWDGRGKLNMRRVSECVYHLIHAHRWDDASLPNALLDIEYIAAKVQAQQTTQLLQEIVDVLQMHPPDWPWRSDLSLLRNFISLNSHAFSLRPYIVLQTALNQPSSSFLCQSAKKVVENSKKLFSPEISPVTIPPVLSLLAKPETYEQRTMVVEIGDVLFCSRWKETPIVAVSTLSALAHVINTQTGEIIRQFTDHENWVSAICFSPRTDIAALAWATKTVCRVSDAMTGSTLFDLDLHRYKSVRAFAWSPSSEQILICEGKDLLLGNGGEKDSAVRIFNLPLSPEAGPVECTHHTKFEGSNIGGSECIIDVTPKLNLISWPNGATVEIWRPDATRVGTLTGHSKTVSSVKFAPTADRLASASAELLRVWFIGPEGDKNDVIFSLDRNLSMIFAWTSADTLFCGVPPPTKEYGSKIRDKVLVESLSARTGECVDVTRFAYGKRCGGVTVTRDGKAESMIVLEEAMMTVWSLFEHTPEAEAGSSVLHRGAVDRLVFSPDAKYIASAVYRGYSDNVVAIWSAATGKKIWHVEEQSDVGDLDFSPNSRQIVISGFTKFLLNVRDIDTGNVLHSFAGSCAKYIDENRIVSGSRDGIIGVFDLTSNNWIWKSEKQEYAWFYQVCISTDGGRVASSTAQCDIAIRSTADGTVLAQSAKDFTPLRYNRDKFVQTIEFTSATDLVVVVRKKAKSWVIVVEDTIFRQVDLEMYEIIDRFFGRYAKCSALDCRLRIEQDLVDQKMLNLTVCASEGERRGTTATVLASILALEDVAARTLKEDPESNTIIVAFSDNNIVRICHLNILQIATAKSTISEGERQRQIDATYFETITRTVVSYFENEISSAGSDDATIASCKYALSVWADGDIRTLGSRRNTEIFWQAATSSDASCSKVAAAAIASLSKLVRFHKWISYPVEQWLKGHEGRATEEFEKIGWKRARDFWEMKKIINMSGTNEEGSYGPLDWKGNIGKQERELQVWIGSRTELGPREGDQAVARVTRVLHRTYFFWAIIDHGINTWIVDGAAAAGVSLEREKKDESKSHWGFSEPKRHPWQLANERYNLAEKRSFPEEMTLEHSLEKWISEKSATDLTSANFYLKKLKQMLRSAFTIADDETARINTIFDGDIVPAIDKWIADGMASGEAEGEEEGWDRVLKLWKGYSAGGKSDMKQKFALATPDDLLSQKFFRYACNFLRLSAPLEDAEYLAQKSAFDASIIQPLQAWLNAGPDSWKSAAENWSGEKGKKIRDALWKIWMGEDGFFDLESSEDMAGKCIENGKESLIKAFKLKV